MKTQTLNLEATVTDLEGNTVKAKDVICDNKVKIIFFLETIKAIPTNWLAKAALGLVIELVESIVEKACG